MKPQRPTVTPPVVTASSRDAWLTTFLAISGVVALVYEVIWQRQFALIFGSSAPAAAAVLSAYFTGLGLGAWWIGRRVHRWHRPLRTYAILEVSIGVGALAVSPFLNVFENIYPNLFQYFEGHRGLLLSIRALAALVALLLPTFCMGGTLPLLGTLVDHGQRHLGLTAGWLYFANTAGAALGALAVPFILLPSFGMLHTVWGSSVLNMLLAVGAWFLDTKERRLLALAPGSALPSAEVVKSRRRKAAPPPIVLPFATGWLAFISGFATFALQILWNRAFAQIHENSMYSFAVVVAVTIIALAVGAQLARLGLKRHFSPPRFLATAWMIGGAIIMISPWLFIAFSDGFAYLNHGSGWYAQAGHLTALAISLLLIPMALVGIGFPTLMEAAGRSSDADSGRALGRVFSINVVGSIIGSVVSGFWLPHWLGLWNSLIGLGLVLIATGMIVQSRVQATSSYSFLPYAVGTATIGGLCLISRLDLTRVSVETAASEKQVAVAEGAYGITAVVERPGSRRLKLNNHYGLGGTASTGDERMQAHIPLLLHPAPHRVAFLGLGTGITAGGALLHPVEKITIIELVPEVIDAARVYFREANQAVVEDPRTQIITDDARHALRSRSEKYDVIVGDLVVPWRQGEGSLFTREQFEAARNALSPHGIFCQWLPLFQLSETEVQIITRTFLQVFPHPQVWRGDFSPTEPAIALIASNDDIRFDATALRLRLQLMPSDRTNPQLQSAENFWMNYIGEIDATVLSDSEHRLNVDDRPWVEILGPLLHTGGEEGNIFTGRALHQWERSITQRSQVQLAALPHAEAAAVRAGDTLAEMTLCIYEQNTAGAQAAQAKLRELLPENAFRQLF